MKLLGQRRAELSASATAFGVSAAVAAFAFAVLLGVITAIGHPPGEVATAFWDGAFGGANQLAGTLMVMIPLVLLGLGWVLASSARQINLGLEGQIVAGGIGATLAGTNFDALPPFLHLSITVIAAGLAGAAWAALPALLYVKRDVNVLISSFMLNFVALLLVAYLVRGPLQNPTGLGLIESEPIAVDALWPKIGEVLRWDVMLIPLAVIAVAVVQRATTVGFRLRLIAANESAAERVGIATKRIGAIALMTSGALAGVAGSSLVLDSFTGSMSDSFSSGYGFIGIAVALLARNSPVGCIASALLFAALQQGGALIEARVGVTSASVQVAQGLVIILIALSSWLLIRLTRNRSEAALAPEIDGAV